ncbi:MAG: hypothetical protein RJA22_1866 [Verrucomicrobiota bacterium]
MVAMTKLPPPPTHAGRRLFPAAWLILAALLIAGARAAEGELEVPPDLNALRAMAESGQAKAQTELADILAGSGDFTNAVVWYRKAAQQGEVASQLTLATLLITGRGAAKNPREAAQWLRAAADRIERASTQATNAAPTSRSNAPTALTTATNAAAAPLARPTATNALAGPAAVTNAPKVRRADALQSVPPKLQEVPRETRPPKASP